MVHLRLNETEVNPNPHVNFITALPSTDDIQEESKHLLRALAAQVKPVMKSHGFTVNSLEEYEYNQVFAGRNWNNGETVELVLRRPGGEFYPSSWLMSTLCHELAHIKHMNHGPAFQALWKLLRVEVGQLQARGYYGDGYWSSGQRLADSARIPGDGIESGDFPEYMCGGAQQRTRPTAHRRRRAPGVPRGPRKGTVASLHTGRQTAVKRKAGGRVTSKYAFAGEGSALGSSMGGAEGGSKGKRAASNRAREERALAAERRIQALLGASAASAPDKKKENEESDSSDTESDMELVTETDADRRQALVSSKHADDDIEVLGTGKSWKMFEDEFSFASGSGSNPHSAKGTKNREASSSGSRKHLGTIAIDSDDDAEEEGGCDIPKTSGSLSTTGQSSQQQSTTTRTGKGKTKGALGLGKLVQTEIDFRKKESLGMAPTKAARMLGKKPQVRASPAPLAEEREPAEQWSCVVCTLINEPESGTCVACETPRGKGL